MEKTPFFVSFRINYLQKECFSNEKAKKNLLFSKRVVFYKTNAASMNLKVSRNESWAT